MARLRQYVFPVAVVVVLFLLGTVAIASHGLEDARENVPEGVELPEVTTEHLADFQVEGNGNGEVGVSQFDGKNEEHGECVSKIAEETEGDPDQGEIVSKAATPWQEEGSTDDCWFFTESFPPGFANGDGPEIENGASPQIQNGANGAEFGAQRANEARARGNNGGS